jgi:heterodisulfide reductase subunit C
MTLLKNMAVKEGHAPAGVRAQLDLIKTHGRIYPLDDFDNKKRTKINLPVLPTSCKVMKDLFPEE